ncbi:uncharacterized protein LOC107857702 [Capsicum annuum]|uniref:uncharacterized protein LOC107857702 n=1 Tax=Capsicum annuum TaxID=4072 RepID=UPI0007BEF005|nr:uncharacterized protein LOC107857702 [Capsicum annuum]
MDKEMVIRERLKTAQSYQKSYANVRRNELKFEASDWVFLKCVGDPFLTVPVEDVGVTDSSSYEEVSIEILDRQVYRLRTKYIASMKVLYRNQKVEEATWEAEEDVKVKYSFLFPALDENT